MKDLEEFALGSNGPFPRCIAAGPQLAKGPSASCSGGEDPNGFLRNLRLELWIPGIREAGGRFQREPSLKLLSHVISEHNVQTISGMGSNRYGIIGLGWVSMLFFGASKPWDDDMMSTGDMSGGAEIP